MWVEGFSQRRGDAIWIQSGSPVPPDSQEVSWISRIQSPDARWAVLSGSDRRPSRSSARTEGRPDNCDRGFPLEYPFELAGAREISRRTRDHTPTRRLRTSVSDSQPTPEITLRSSAVFAAAGGSHQRPPTCPRIQTQREAQFIRPVTRSQGRDTSSIPVSELSGGVRSVQCRKRIQPEVGFRPPGRAAASVDLSVGLT